MTDLKRCETIRNMRKHYYQHLRKQVDFGRGMQSVASQKTVRGIAQGEQLYSDTGFAPVTQAWEDKRLFVWSDHHLFHRNICRYAGRPFDSLFRMHEVFLSHAQTILKDDDVVLWGGDVSFGNKSETQEFLRQLPGKHFLLLGNHDVDRKEKLETYIEAFEGVSDCLTLELGHYHLWLSHYPLLAQDIPKQTINVHGHIHQHLLDGPFVNMCVEHTNYKPVLLHELVKASHPYIHLKE